MPARHRQTHPTHGNVRLGFVYERVPHITLKSIANNAEIDVIWERWQETLEPLRAELNNALGRTWEEWEIPREPGVPWSEPAASAWNKLHASNTVEAREAALRSLNRVLNRHYTLDDVPNVPRDPWEPVATELHTKWWEARIARQREIDASIASKADFEYLYDKPYEDRRKVRVAGPFTVESISPHRVLNVDENDELVDNVAEARLGYGETQDFAGVILEHLRTSGVQQAHKEDRIAFSSITPGRANSSARKGATSRAARRPAPGNAQRSSSVPSSAPSRVPIWLLPPGRRRTSASTC